MSRKGLAISIVIVLVFSISFKRLDFRIDYSQLALVQGILAFLITIKTWLCISLACDSIITIAVIAFLRRARGTITGALRDLMNKFILKSLETGVLVALAAAAELFLFRLYPFTYLSVVSLFMLSRLYTMALLASLNGRTRASLVDREHVHTVSTWRVATIPFSMAMKSQN
ncbi:hypothetical protein AX16_003942 [Volvariella volvacea WC 439]|nr:hypothetical protein AX16_003942 [Volvariella volvacea WC 439]